MSLQTSQLCNRRLLRDTCGEFDWLECGVRLRKKRFVLMQSFEYSPPLRAKMAGFLYGSGIRLLECCCLRIKDLDLDTRRVFVHAEKGDRDRVAVLPRSLVKPLRSHLETVCVQHERDRAAGAGWVEMSGALARNCPHTARGRRCQRALHALPTCVHAAWASAAGSTITQPPPSTRFARRASRSRPRVNPFGTSWQRAGLNGVSQSRRSRNCSVVATGEQRRSTPLSSIEACSEWRIRRIAVGVSTLTADGGWCRGRGVLDGCRPRQDCGAIDRLERSLRLQTKRSASMHEFAVAGFLGPSSAGSE